MSLESVIEKDLEKIYNIKFNVINNGTLLEPFISIIPEDDENNLFEITARINNYVRVVIEFSPRKYSSALINEMGRASLEKKTEFCDDVLVLKRKGIHIQLKINDKEVNATSFEDWEPNWVHLNIKTNQILKENLNMEMKNKQLVELTILTVGLILPLLNIIKPMSNNKPQAEGTAMIIQATKYERSQLNRAMCIYKYGYNCAVCGMNFLDTYGDIGKEFIHVHHIIPVSHIGPGYIIDPENDLIPVCPNCHCMLHKKDPPYNVDELKNMLKDKCH